MTIAKNQILELILFLEQSDDSNSTKVDETNNCSNNNNNGKKQSHVKKGILKNFTKFSGKHLCKSIFFNKVAG